MSWGRMDSGWIREKRLVGFQAGAHTGRSLAALKVLLAIAAYVAYDSASAALSYGDLALVTGLSRPMVIRGVARLEEAGLIEVTRGQGINTYRLVDATTPPWSKVPLDLIEKQLQRLPNRGQSALAALKILLVLLVFRGNHDSRTSIGHRAIVEYTGIRPAHVRAGVDHLVNHGFVHLDADDQFTKHVGHPVHIYTIRGRFYGGAYRPLRPMEMIGRITDVDSPPW